MGVRLKEESVKLSFFLGLFCLIFLSSAFSVPQVPKGEVGITSVHGQEIAELLARIDEVARRRILPERLILRSYMEVAGKVYEKYLANITMAFMLLNAVRDSVSEHITDDVPRREGLRVVEDYKLAILSAAMDRLGVEKVPESVKEGLTTVIAHITDVNTALLRASTVLEFLENLTKLIYGRYMEGVLPYNQSLELLEALAGEVGTLVEQGKLSENLGTSVGRLIETYKLEVLLEELEKV